MLDVARRRIAEDRFNRVEVRRSDVRELDVPDASVETVVSTFRFCTIPDPLKASKEALRVPVPGGRIVLAEHGPATNKIGLTLMRAVEPLFVRFGADHLTRDPAPYRERAGSTIDTVYRSGRGGTGFRVLAHKRD